ncbi:hypothetical protein D9615_004202 [Tricholomella constricta]|uniref:DNA 3'-5' helicase n=1 Tax=Tricholomella constricta TaxID=117010 RepID=A0A8H5HEL0_9AGAR|nr:hypothetical protein D9615_004202 [Tricholomella constricta]
MAPLLWQSQLGRDTIQRIVKHLVPDWTDGLRDWQLDIVSRILDGEDVLVSTATGDGKSAIFATPLLVLLELRRAPFYYPRLPCRVLPMGIVITPTKGLAANIVFETSKLGIRAIAYCSEVLTEARKTGRQIWKEIAAGEWPLVCVDPEHLTAKDWEHITNTDLWRANILFLCVDEIHLVRCPPHISVIGLSATMEPGVPTSTICDAMGFVSGHFHHLQRTNERPNIHFVLRTLTHTLGGNSFPDLLPYLAAGRKTVIYCETIELCFRVAVYLWGLLPSGLEKLTRVRLYHALCWPDENEETIRLICDDPHCQIVVATVAFAQGINVKPLLDCIQLGVPSTMNQIVQQEGRIGRDQVSLARGIVLVQAKAVESAIKYMHAHFPLEMGPPAPKATKASKRVSMKKKASKPTRLDIPKARLLVKDKCLILLRNTVYRNPPLELTARSCITACRRVPCSLCLPLSSITLEFPPPLRDPSHSPLAPFRTPPGLICTSQVSASQVSAKGELSLKPKMREEVMKSLDVFRNSIRKLEKGSDPTGCTPRAAYFPAPLATLVVTHLMSITAVEDIKLLLSDWVYLSGHATRLNELVLQLQEKFRAQHNEIRLLQNEKNRIRAKAKRDAASNEAGDTPDGNDELEDEADHDHKLVGVVVPSPSPVKPPTSSMKRAALSDDTNGSAPKCARRAPRAPQASSSEVSQSFGPRYRTRTDRSRRARITDENRID